MIIMQTTMFGFFRKKSPAQQLNAKYRQLLSEAHMLSATNRAASDKKYAEANEVLSEIEDLAVE